MISYSWFCWCAACAVCWFRSKYSTTSDISECEDILYRLTEESRTSFPNTSQSLTSRAWHSAFLVFSKSPWLPPRGSSFLKNHMALIDGARAFHSRGATWLSSSSNIEATEVDGCSRICYQTYSRHVPKSVLSHGNTRSCEFVEEFISVPTCHERGQNYGSLEMIAKRHEILPAVILLSLLSFHRQISSCEPKRVRALSLEIIFYIFYRASNVPEIKIAGIIWPGSSMNAAVSFLSCCVASKRLASLDIFNMGELPAHWYAVGENQWAGTLLDFGLKWKEALTQEEVCSSALAYKHQNCVSDIQPIFKNASPIVWLSMACSRLLLSRR